MLQDRYETDKLFDNILKLTNQMDPVLAEIDQLLEDEALYHLIRNDLAKRYPQTEQTGRNSTPVEVILRMLAAKRLYGLSYERPNIRCVTVWSYANFVGLLQRSSR